MAAVRDGDTVECSYQETADWLRWQIAAYKDTRQITITVDESWKDRRVSKTAGVAHSDKETAR